MRLVAVSKSDHTPVLIFSDSASSMLHNLPCTEASLLARVTILERRSLAPNIIYPRRHCGGGRVSSCGLAKLIHWHPHRILILF